MKQAPNKELKCYLDTFNRASGHKVLRDLMNAFDYTPVTLTNENCQLAVGSRAVIDYIKERMKAACGSNKKVYADIMYETEMSGR